MYISVSRCFDCTISLCLGRYYVYPFNHKMNNLVMFFFIDNALHLYSQLRNKTLYLWIYLHEPQYSVFDLENNYILTYITIYVDPFGNFRITQSHFPAGTSGLSLYLSVSKFRLFLIDTIRFKAHDWIVQCVKFLQRKTVLCFLNLNRWHIHCRIIGSLLSKVLFSSTVFIYFINIIIPCSRMHWLLSSKCFYYSPWNPIWFWPNSIYPNEMYLITYFVLKT